MVKKVKAKKTEMPTGVKIISILYYIGAVLGLLGGIALILGGGAIASLLGPVGFLGGGLVAFTGIIVIAFSILGFFIGKGLWDGKSWARILAAILATLGFLGALMGLLSGDAGNIVSLLINGFIGWYLLFNEQVKKAFN